MNEWLKSVRNAVKLPQRIVVPGVKLSGHFGSYGLSGNFKGVESILPAGAGARLKVD